MKEDMGVVNEMTSSTIKLGNEIAIFRQKAVARIIRFGQKSA